MSATRSAAGKNSRLSTYEMSIYSYGDEPLFHQVERVIGRLGARVVDHSSRLVCAPLSGVDMTTVRVRLELPRSNQSAILAEMWARLEAFEVDHGCDVRLDRVPPPTMSLRPLRASVRRVSAIEGGRRHRRRRWSPMDRVPIRSDHEEAPLESWTRRSPGHAHSRGWGSC